MQGAVLVNEVEGEGEVAIGGLVVGGLGGVAVVVEVFVHCL